MPRNCRHCTKMTCGEANWCAARQEVLSDAQIAAYRRCPSYEPNPVDALTLDDPKQEAARERELYEKRMRGDWT